MTDKTASCRNLSSCGFSDQRFAYRSFLRCSFHQGTVEASFKDIKSLSHELLSQGESPLPNCPKLFTRWLWVNCTASAVQLKPTYSAHKAPLSFAISMWSARGRQQCIYAVSSFMAKQQQRHDEQKRFRNEITDLNEQRMQFILNHRSVFHLSVMQRFDKKNMTVRSDTHLTH